MEAARPIGGIAQQLGEKWGSWETSTRSVDAMAVPERVFALQRCDRTIVEDFHDSPEASLASCSNPFPTRTTASALSIRSICDNGHPSPDMHNSRPFLGASDPRQHASEWRVEEGYCVGDISPRPEPLLA
ncbi:hypothetical protein NMY22_g12510 [Coprinellus aureogranulatus]|nr:hypothetical protein NMY22_g12510 [Coprinellus aureogranulatus]